MSFIASFLGIGAKNVNQSENTNEAAAAAAASAVLVAASMEQLEKEINGADAKKLVAIDFYAPWCGPCKVIGPEFERLASVAPYNDRTKVSFVKCDVEAVKEAQEKYSIKSVPYFLFMKNKSKVAEMCGANKEKLKQLLDENIAN